MSDVNFSQQDHQFMRQAIALAAQAEQQGEVPVGAIVVCNDLIIAKAHNQTELLNDVTAHAEIIALTAAAEYLGNKIMRLHQRRDRFLLSTN